MRALLFGLLWLLAGCAALGSAGVAAGGGQPAPPVGEEALYLPFMIRDNLVLQGAVTQAGQPAAGLTVTLSIFDLGVAFSAGTQVTDAAGTYAFQGLQELPAGAAYFVTYENTVVAPDRLAFWRTESKTTFGPGGIIEMPPFDVAAVELLAPADGAEAAMPVSFQWTPRVMTGDVYQVEIYGHFSMTDTSITLLPVDSPGRGTVTAACLNPPAIAGAEYRWRVGLEHPGAGYGFMPFRTVRFSAPVTCARP